MKKFISLILVITIFCSSLAFAGDVQQSIKEGNTTDSNEVFLITDSGEIISEKDLPLIFCDGNGKSMRLKLIFCYPFSKNSL